MHYIRGMDILSVVVDNRDEFVFRQHVIVAAPTTFQFAIRLVMLRLSELRICFQLIGAHILDGQFEIQCFVTHKSLL